MSSALDDPQTRTDLAATRAGALRWLGGGAVAVVLGVLVGVATARVTRDGGERVPGAGLLVLVLVLLGLCALVVGVGSYVRVTAWTRGLGRTTWQPGRLRIAGPAALRVEPTGGGEDVDLQLLSTATWRTRAVQRLADADVRIARVGDRRWVLTADGAGTVYGAKEL
ncbi:hypothetical protein [Modestobacter sp. Leaf380]|uniref:hypothetical protein n=1 Tax=Modestobacter sp. Leaf380 TaxID=1736356 RepID=UPI0006F6AF93|nr:hypothetical protein [Modestobacter sp. Leaf380]KQS68968.1 hypothetical protein ASG41_06120 [Modestobacter sp. Leaf380]